jgi:hypothetical protein
MKINFLKQLFIASENFRTYIFLDLEKQEGNTGMQRRGNFPSIMFCCVLFSRSWLSNPTTSKIGFKVLIPHGLIGLPAGLGWTERPP